MRNLIAWLLLATCLVPVSLAEARYYDPKTGRFLQEDPVEFADRHMNRYRYVRNNPVNFTDPWGLVDLNLFPEKEPIYQNSENTPSPGETFTVGAHGNAGGPVDPTTRKPISAEDMADQIRQNPKYQPGETVRLDSCNVGRGDFAQELANELNAPVQAPDNYVWIYSNGDVVVAPAQDGSLIPRPDPTRRGQYSTFTPQSQQ